MGHATVLGLSRGVRHEEVDAPKRKFKRRQRELRNRITIDVSNNKDERVICNASCSTDVSTWDVFSAGRFPM